MEDESLTLARVAERAERWDEMADYMRERIEKGTALNPEERDMFSAAFKGALTGRRLAVRVAASVGQQEQEAGNVKSAELARGYLSKVEAELQGVCDKALGLLRDRLVPTSADAESKTFYHKMQGDYHRYTVEFARMELRDAAAREAGTAYAAGMAEADRLATTHPVRLGLALNFSVFQQEILGDTPAAVRTATDALSAASAMLNSMPEDARQEAYVTMSLLQDNLQLWQPGLAES